MTKIYQELLKQIQQAIENNEVVLARQLIEQELSMPYIPREVEEKLVQFQSDFGEKEIVLKQIDFNTLMKWFEVESSAFMTLDSLKYHNLRMYQKELMEMALKAPSKELLSMLCLECKQQGLDISLCGIEIASLQVPYENEGYQWLFNQIRKDWDAQPNMVEILSQLLVHEYLLILPNYYEFHEISKVYLALVKEGLSLSKGIAAWYDYTAKNHVNEPSIALAIQYLALKD